MPELPDIPTYVDGLERTLVDRQLQAVEIASPFVLRTVSPSAADLVGQTVRGASRLNKRLVLHFDAEEILFAAGLFPLLLNSRLDGGQFSRPRRRRSRRASRGCAPRSALAFRRRQRHSAG